MELTVAAEYLTSREVCKLLRITRNTLQNWLNAGKIKGKLVGNKYLFRSEDVRRLLP
jgi:excisionase family DNA binding protein